MLRRCLGSVIIRIGLQNRFQNFKQRASKGIQIGSVVFVAIFSWRRAQKKKTDLPIRMRNWLKLIICIAESGFNTSCHKNTPIQKLSRICKDKKSFLPEHSSMALHVLCVWGGEEWRVWGNCRSTCAQTRQSHPWLQKLAKNFYYLTE